MRVPCLVAMVSALAVTMVGPLRQVSRASGRRRARPTASPTSKARSRSRTITPLQRPEALADKDVLTPEEAAAFEASENIRLNRDLFDSGEGCSRAPDIRRDRRAACSPTTISGMSAATR